PLTVLPCRDGHVSLGVVTELEFDKLAIVLERPELAVDPRFADKAARWDNCDALDAELAPFLQGHDAEAIVALLQAGGVACAKVAGPLDVTANPQLALRGFWQEVPGGGVMPGDPLGHFHPFEGGGSAPIGPPGLLPLAGVRVLDFTVYWAGPSATRCLADLGAEVVWIERPGSRLDTILAAGEAATPAEVMAHLHASKMYRGKQSIELDLERAADRAITHQLARDAHVVIENFRPGVADKLGIGPRELAAINPGLVYVSLSGWGSDGPWAGWRSYGPSIEAASSIEGRTGYGGGEPMRLGHTLPDAVGGLVGALTALRGLRRQLEGGPGGWFDISQLEAYVAMAGEGIVEATRYGRGLERIGNRARGGAVQGVFPCRGEDQWIALRLEDAADCARFADFSGMPDGVLADPKEADTAIAAFTRPHDKIALAARLQGQGIEAFAVLDAFELLADPHLAARGFFVDVQAGDRAGLIPGTPLVAQPSLADARGAAPRPDEHSAAIRATLAELGQPA
ncbi:MAG: CoA transferase, partial [Novosphingobium sp.]|nr:CoA transferase [Novosphingobium sp.]